MWRRAERPDLEVVMDGGIMKRPVVTLIDDAIPEGDLRAHVVVDDYCYRLVKVGVAGTCYGASWIFREAHEALRDLPLLDGEPEQHSHARMLHASRGAR